MIDRRDQEGFDKTSHVRRRELTGEHEIDGLTERDASHHFVQYVSPHQDLVWLDRSERRAPLCSGR